MLFFCRWSCRSFVHYGQTRSLVLPPPLTVQLLFPNVCSFLGHGPAWRNHRQRYWGWVLPPTPGRGAFCPPAHLLHHGRDLQCQCPPGRRVLPLKGPVRPCLLPCHLLKWRDSKKEWVTLSLNSITLCGPSFSEMGVRRILPIQCILVSTRTNDAFSLSPHSSPSLLDPPEGSPDPKHARKLHQNCQAHHQGWVGCQLCLGLRGIRWCLLSESLSVSLGSGAQHSLPCKLKGLVQFVVCPGRLCQNTTD